jgi:hypothetical protein
VVLVLTDGVDTNSVLPEQSSKAILERTDSTLYCVEVAEWPHLWVFGFGATSAGPQLTYDVINSGVFDDSGGRHVVVRPEDDFVVAVPDLLASLRSRYLLRYILVALTGQDGTRSRFGRSTARTTFERAGDISDNPETKPTSGQLKSWLTIG